MIGLTPVPSGTLTDTTLELMREGPLDPALICARVMGMPQAPRAVAERLCLALLGSDPRVRRLADGCWTLVATATGSPLLEECAFAVVDVETTGMRAADADRITVGPVALTRRYCAEPAGVMRQEAAIAAEVAATSALKSSEGFTRPWPSLVVVVGYATAFYFLSLTLKVIPVAVAYAVWSGMGIVLIAVVAWALYGQKLDAWGVVGISMILGGVLVLNLLSRSSAN